MKISELFKRLSYGELSNLSIANQGDGTLKTASYPKFVQYTNEALLRLHSRFVLIEKSVLIEQISDRTVYPLTSDYAVSNVGSTEPDKFIQDADDPFVDDVIKIFRVTDEVGFRYPLNDDNADYSLFTPKPHVLQIPTPDATVPLSVTYQARHPALDPYLVDVDDLLAQDVEVPFTLESALTNYIAHLTYSHMNGQENVMKSQEFQAKYEEICAQIATNDLVNQSIAVTSEKFEDRGFV